MICQRETLKDVGQASRSLILAERVGFEPTDLRSRSTDFESAPFDHSGTSPLGKRNITLTQLLYQAELCRWRVVVTWRAGPVNEPLSA